MELKTKAFALEYLKYCTFISALFGVSSLGYAGVSFVSLALVIFAFSGKSPMRAYVAVFAIYLLVAGNPYIIVSKPFALGLARYLTIAAIAFKSYAFFLSHPKRYYIINKVKGAYIPLIVFVVVAILTSFLSAWYIHISLLKAIQFFVFVSSLLLFKLCIDEDQSREIFIWCLAFLSFILLASLAQFLINPTVVYYVDEWMPGQFVNTDLFCGIIYHPQSFGLVCVFTVAHILAVYFNTKSLFLRLFFAGLILLSICYIPLTQSRTSLFALIFIASTAFIRNLFFLNSINITQRRRVFKNTMNSLSLILITSIAALVLSGPILISYIEGLFFKYSIYRMSFTDMFYSRVDFIQNSWEAFLRSPLYGEGFGVEKSHKFVETAGLFTAPSEKCFIPTAILHELGIVGAFAFIYFLSSITIWAIKNKYLNFTFLLYGFILVNFGEYIFFSVGGAGCLAWLVLISNIEN